LEFKNRIHELQIQIQYLKDEMEVMYLLASKTSQTLDVHMDNCLRELEELLLDNVLFKV